MKPLQSLSKNAKALPMRTRQAMLGALLLAVMLLPVGIFALDEARASGEVARNVFVGGVALGGLGEADALEAIRAYEMTLGATPVDYKVSGESFELLPREIGLDIDEAAVVANAMDARRQQGFLGRFFDWFGSFSDRIEIDAPAEFDVDLLDEHLDDWEQAAINNPAFEGGVRVEDGRAFPEYPRAGEGIDRADAAAATEQAIQDLQRSPITLVTRDIQPVVTDADIDAAVERATRIIDDSIVLQANDPELEIEFPSGILARALVTEVRTTEVSTTDSAQIDMSFDRGPIARILADNRDLIEQPARDAAFEIGGDDSVTLIPSRPETLLDVELVVAHLFDVADRGGTTGTFPFAEGVQPEFTTEMAEAMGEITRVSSATTEHPCCEARVTNIQTMAKTVDGAIVMPGESFDLNEFVGKRTTEKGYVPAPMILRGEIVDDVGGGVSQFATTLYNAVFFGCYEDVEHRPHSRYFSRYPEGREATISWGGPELIFRNDTEAILIIKTAFSSRSITVKMFGNTGGRECSAGLSDRYNYTDPPVEFEEDPTIPPGQPKEETGSRGWTVDIFRYITHTDGTKDTEKWTHRYQPTPTTITAHPCDMEGAPDPCQVAVPNVVGQKQGTATSTLQTWSFEVVREKVEVQDESKHNVVLSQSPQGSANLGSKVTIRVGEFVGEPGDGGEAGGGFAPS